MRGKPSDIFRAPKQPSEDINRMYVISHRHLHTRKDVDPSPVCHRCLKFKATITHSGHTQVKW